MSSSSGWSDILFLKLFRIGLLIAKDGKILITLISVTLVIVYLPVSLNINQTWYIFTATIVSHVARKKVLRIDSSIGRYREPPYTTRTIDLSVRVTQHLNEATCLVE